MAERAAEHDISQAAFGLAELYGASDQPDYDTGLSRQWLRRAADLGNPSAAFNLGWALLQVPEPDSAQAERYLAVAAGKSTRKPRSNWPCCVSRAWRARRNSNRF